MIDFRRHWEANVAFFSAPATWHQSGQALALRAAYAVPRDTDGQIVNALAVGVRMITIRERDTAGRAPRPLDMIDIGGEQLTIDAVTPVLMQGVLLGWRCMTAGQGAGP